MKTSNDSAVQPIRRRRGGQPGNANHLKHGLYARPVFPFKHRDPADIPVTDLADEIGIYQLCIQQYGETIISGAVTDPDIARRNLLTLAYAGNQLAALVRIQARASLFTSTNREFQTWLASLPSPQEENAS
jgi:hypothetical protein